MLPDLLTYSLSVNVPSGTATLLSTCSRYIDHLVYRGLSDGSLLSRQWCWRVHNVLEPLILPPTKLRSSETPRLAL